MPATLTPLRYPGGKTKNYRFVKTILDANDLHGTYIEPFAGGAGLAIKLLLYGDVKKIVINDSDRAIYSFWRCVLEHTEDLCAFIETVPLTREEWEKQRYIYMNKEKFDELELGKATFYLNRTNISGVIKGGLIGGNSQNGNYKMDARFNRKNLIRKIRDISLYKDSIDLYSYDVFDLFELGILNKYHNSIINFDPPYVKKGSQLYMNYFTYEDHEKLRNIIAKIHRKWIVTYDNCELIEDLYKKYRKSYVDIRYSINESKKTQELVFFSKNLILPDSITLY